MPLKLWERYFLRELAKVFFLFIFGFYFLYILIDYTSRTGSLLSNSAGFTELTVYYGLTFLKRVDLLVPFALLVGTIRALVSFNFHNELVALLSGGIPLKRLLRPFLAAGIACAILLYCNFQWLAPLAWSKVQQIEDRHSSMETSTAGHAIQDVSLNDGSLILCQSYDSARNFFFDAYWIRSIDDIWRIKYLHLDTEAAVGKYVDHLARNEEGEFQLVESFETKVLQEIQFDEENLQAALRNPEELSLAQLWQRRPTHDREYTDKEAGILARFYSHLAMPLLCILAVIAPAPFCIRFSRQIPVLFIYILSIMGIVSFYLVADATLVIARAQVLPPALAIFTPYALYFWLFGRRYIRL
ncbi:Uncharacterized protein SCG7086_AA_00390 [Chlamydiales bacterium SCGC AG-110-P3]|nr:Uncharacterized protein SCG7086_AA_00390 [Chlamydiales bacterium SCGC AG-110-P3]